MYNNNNNHKSSSTQNGSNPFVPPNYLENNHGFPSDFSEEEYIDLSERKSQPLTEQGRQNLRLLQRFYITLIVTGVVIGGFLTWGVYGIMKHFDLIDPPSKQQLNNQELIINN